MKHDIESQHMLTSTLPYEQVVCSNCSASTAYRAFFDEDGHTSRTICFECGHSLTTTSDGVYVEKLRHKCRVRFVLG
jgi:hypothetical protein